MTRDQDLERHLTDWLSEGPSVAPDEVVDRAIESSAGRRQRHPAWVRVRSSLEQMRWGAGHDRRWQRLAVVAATMALIVSTTLLVALPLAGGPAPAPTMDPTGARGVTGSGEVVEESEAGGLLERVLRMGVGDPRVDGTARQVLRLEGAPAAGLERSTGVMRLENEWGAWEGTISGVRYPDSTAIEYGWLTGSGAYEGFTYLYSTYGIPAGTERAIEGAIWPGEPPPMPDPSLLP